MCKIVIYHNAFNLSKDKEVLPAIKNATISNQDIPNLKNPYICVVNDKPILRDKWDEIVLKENDVLSIISLPKGGGGGGSKILRTVLTIAVIIAAPYAGAALAGMVGVTSTIGTGLITAGVFMAGSMLVNALIPPPTPSVNNNSQLSNPSPTYSLQSQGNQSRIGGVIPVIYGKHIIYPDFGAKPYSEFIDDNQYLYQLHIIGQGEYEISDIKIEDTLITNFKEITYQITTPNNELTLFNPNVITADEVSGQELISIEDEGDWVGPFIANPAMTITNQIAIDVIMPKGLYFANDNGSLGNLTISWKVEARKIDEYGVGLSDWIVLGSESLTDNSNNPIRKTYKYAVEDGRYEVRLLRLDNKDKSVRAGHDINWSGLKSCLTSKTDLSGLTAIALKMKATNNLSQTSSRKLNLIASRKLKTWNSETGWSNLVETNSIAWALVDILKSSYGAKLSDDRIDLLALEQLDKIWNERGDSFNAVFDSKITIWDALTKTARCGRAKAFLQAGIVRFVRDEEIEVPTAMFTPRNIVKNSFNIEYLMSTEDTATQIKVEYFNSLVWKQDEVTFELEEIEDEENIATVNLFGCTNKEQALREANYMALANRYRRKMITFRTELDGLVLTYGDLITISHDMLKWGISGEIIEYNYPLLKLSENIEFIEGQNYQIIFRKLDGSISGPWRVKPSLKDFDVLLDEEIDFVPYTGSAKERTYFTVGEGNSYGINARVLSVKPRGDEVEISAIVENNKVHIGT